MDNFLSEQRADGQLQTEGEFHLDPAAAFQKMRECRAQDRTFPYWKLLQAAVAMRASRVCFSLARSSVTIEVYSGQPAPTLEQFCEQLPNTEPLLEALRSSALALCSEEGETVWVRETPRGATELAERSGAGYSLSSSKTPPKLPKKTGEGHRLCLIHHWNSNLGLLARVLQGGKVRAEIHTAMTDKTDFYPVPLYNSGRLWVLPALDPHVPIKKAASLLSNLYSHRPCGLIFKMGARSLDEFLCEALLESTYCKVLHNLKGVVYDKRRQQEVRDASVLLLESPSDLAKADGFFGLPLGERFPAWVPSTRTIGKGPSYYCEEALLIPQWSGERNGWIAVIDRGLLVDLCPADLGIPGAFLMCGRGRLKMDLGGTSVVKDNAWESMVACQRQATVNRARFIAPHVGYNRGRKFLGSLNL